MKSLRISVAITLTFLACWTPYYVLMIVSIFIHKTVSRFSIPFSCPSAVHNAWMSRWFYRQTRSWKLKYFSSECPQVYSTLSSMDSTMSGDQRKRKSKGEWICTFTFAVLPEKKCSEAFHTIPLHPVLIQSPAALEQNHKKVSSNVFTLPFPGEPQVRRHYWQLWVCVRSNPLWRTIVKMVSILTHKPKTGKVPGTRPVRPKITTPANGGTVRKIYQT